MFSVQQKRDISDAVQKILRATSHPELPTTGEISFNLNVRGAETWSFADIQNNAAVGNPEVNPHNELMASLPPKDARELLDVAKKITSYSDPRATPEEFLKEMLKAEIELLRDRMNSLVKSVEGFAQNAVAYEARNDRLQNDHHAHEMRLTQLENFLTPIIEDNLIQHHGDQLRHLMTAVGQLSNKAT